MASLKRIAGAFGAVLLAASPLFAQFQIKKGSVDVSRYYFLRDSADFTPETGFTITGLDLQYTRFGASPATKVDATALAATNSAHADDECIEVDATSSPGVYRCDWPDAAFATGASGVVLCVTATGVDPSCETIQLVDYNPEDGVRLGLTALPNAAADAAGGLPISDAGGLDLDTKLDVAISSRLAPTTAGRTLDVATTGEAGVDFSNINGTLDAAEIGSDAITAAKVAADAIGSSELAATAVTEIQTGLATSASIGTPTDLGGGATIADNLADMAGATFSSTTDTLEAIRDRGDAAWITGAGTGLTPFASGTAQSGTSSTIQLASGTSFGDDILNENVVKILSGTGAGQARLISDYVGATDTATVTPNWITAPSTDSVYEVVDGPKFVSELAPSVITSAGIESATQAALVVDATEIRAAVGLASANLDTQLSAIVADTGEIGTAGAGLSAIPWNASWDAEVQSEANDALVANRLDELLAADSDIDGAAPPVVGSVFHELMTKTSGSFTYDQATDSLEAVRDNMGTAQTGDAYARLGAPAGASVSADIAAVQSDTNDLQTRVPAALVGGKMDSSVSAVTAAGLSDFFDTDSGTTYGAAVAGSVVKEMADNAGGASLTEGGIADAVWDEILAGHAGAGSTGEALNAAGAAGDPWITSLPGSYTSGQAGYLIGHLGNPAGASLAADIASIQIDTDDLQSKIGTPGNLGSGATLAANTADIEAETDDIGVAGAGLTEAGGTGDQFGAIPWNSAWDAEVQSEATDALNAYDGPTNAEMTAATGAIEAEAQDIQSRLPAALVSGKMDSDTTSLAGSASSASNLAASAQSIVTGSAVSGTLSTTQATTDLTEATNDHYKSRIIIWITGALKGQMGEITAYDGSTKKLTFSAQTEAPANGDMFVIL